MDGRNLPERIRTNRKLGGCLWTLDEDVIAHFNEAQIFYSTANSLKDVGNRQKPRSDSP